MEAPLLLPISTFASSSSITIADDATADHSPPTSSSSSPSTQSIVARFVAVLAIAAVSLFGQHEASRGFHVDVVNAAPRSTAAGRRFDLFFVSNGQASRILHYANRGVEQALFPDVSFPRKKVTRVTVQMAGHNLTAAEGATVEAVAGVDSGEYVISLSPNLMRSSNGGEVTGAVAAAVRRAVARMWLWDGRGDVPASVTEAMVEYLASGADVGEEVTASPANGGDSTCMSARFLGHLEQRRAGFVARLNRAMRDRWSDAAVDAALGVPARPVCAAYRAAALTGGQRQLASLAGSTSDADGSRLAA